VVFALEYMTQVSVTTCTQDFSSKAIRIRELLYSPFNFLIERGPSAAGIKLTGGFVEWSVAAPANISSRFIKIIILT
jgi:hypothetical protein